MKSELDVYYQIIDDAARRMVDERHRYEQETGDKLSDLEYTQQAIRLGILLCAGIAAPRPVDRRFNS